MPYTRAQLEAAIAAVRVNHDPVHLAAWRRRGYGHRNLNADEYLAYFQAPPLTDRVAQTAMIIGYSHAPDCNRLITAAYLDLCRHGALQLASAPAAAA
jgi:hypothetical protein